MAFPGELWRNPTPIVTCEPGSTWAVAVRKALDSLNLSSVRVIETRTLEACSDAIRAGSRRLTLVCWRPEAADEQLRWIWRSTRQDAKPRIVLAQIAASDPRAWLARELGAARTFATTREIRAASSWIRTSLDDQLPTQFNTIREEVYASLPWAAYAT